MNRRGHAGKVDANQGAIVKALNQASIRVQSLSVVGNGCPDLLCGFRGINVVLECKDGDKTPSARALTTAESNWHDTWPGQVCVVKSPEEAVLAVIAEAKKRGVL